MAYGEESWIILPRTKTGNSVQSTDWLLLGYKCSLSGNGDEVFAEYAITYPRVKLKRLQVLVTEAFTADCIIKVWKNGTSGTQLATFTMGATAIDKVVYLDVADTLFEAGDYIAWEIDVIDTSTGIIFPTVLVEPVPEVAAGISDMTTTGAA